MAAILVCVAQGDSDKPADGYDTGAVAVRLRELTDALGWDGFHFVGHDVGCWIGYPFAAAYPSNVRKLVLIDAAVPGVVPVAVALEGAGRRAPVSRPVARP